ncbi:MFS transporter [Catellatospora tritici]|uniref:MFS transporter n=1 Tax=Catellatospora tritici TaxID=2851566 RepID=UPI001C2D5700|nr:MFS transporter [Catellatospora tritici]MBV1849330.1 MFS transporter [Catellatospora tritici]
MRMAKRLVPAPYREVLRVPGFRRLLSGEAVSFLGDGLSVVAISWLAIQITVPERAALVVGAAVAAYTLPAAVGAAALARWLSRVDPRRLVIANALLRAVTLGAAAACYLLGALTPTLYVALLALSSLLAAWGTAGTYTLVSALVPAEQRLAANTLLGTSQTTAIIVGPPLAGVLVALAGPAAVLAFDAATYLVLVAQLRRVPAPAAQDEATPAGGGFRILARRPQLLGLLALTAVFFFLYGPVEVALPLFIVDVLGRDAGFLGVYWAVFGVGALAGGLLAGTLRGVAPWPFAIAVIAGWGACLIPFGFTTSAWVTMAGMAVGGIIYGPFPAFNVTLFQAAADPADLPAVLAARGSVMVAAAPIGAAIGGPLVNWLGPSDTLLASGAATVALAALAAAIPLAAYARRRTTTPRAPSEPVSSGSVA